jgi:anti-sigma factor (TIGR02949 family)
MTNDRGRITDCAEAVRHLATFLDGELDDAVGEELAAHLARCRSCYSRAEFERRLKEQVRATGREEVLPELKHRIRTIVQSFRTEGPSRRPEPDPH